MKSLPVMIGAIAVAALDVAAYQYIKRHYWTTPPITGTPQAATINSAVQAHPQPPVVDVMTVRREDIGKGFKCAGGLLYQTSEKDGIKTITLHTINGRASHCK